MIDIQRPIKVQAGTTSYSCDVVSSGIDGILEKSKSDIKEKVKNGEFLHRDSEESLAKIL
jgi:hypothetical protein